MPILIKHVSEPLCAPPFKEPEVGLAGSGARDTLRSLLLRYCQRTIGGRSILIAGHRGAGKTTLVKSVIEEIFYLKNQEIIESQAIFDPKNQELDARPLYVYLHGPDLVAGVDVLDGDKTDMKGAAPSPTNLIIVNGGASGAAASFQQPGSVNGLPSTGSPAPAVPAASPSPAASNGKTTDSTGTAKEDQPLQARLATLALRQLTVALHQAFATHIGWRMQGAAEVKDAFEHAAQFRLDVERQMEVSDLRWFWDKMDVLESGLLRQGEQRPGYYRATQGSLEIVALASLSEAYTRAIAKDVEESEGQELEEKRERKQEIEKSRERKEIVNAIAGLLSGGVAGAGVAFHSGGSGGASALTAALAFIAASIVTSGILNLATMRSFSQRRSKERKVTYDDSLGSLELMVPILIRRVQDAGLAPVFVVDELDKVDDLESKMDLLLKQLKHIVADKAFCCFLVDREYYESVRNWEGAPGKTRGLTYFGERLYVISRPRDWHVYLEHVLRVNEDSKLVEFAATVLRYVLLARAKMHAIDVRRELEKLPRNVELEDEVDLPADEVLTRPNYLNYFLYQVAVEFLLEDGSLAERIAGDSSFLQPAYDALYYPLRMWEQEQDLNWSLGALAVYLQQRTGVQAA
jgi:hypothetical protein